MSSSKAVLIVEDKADERAIIKDLIRQVMPEVKVLEAANAQDAFQELAKTQVEVLITDLQLPGIDGATLASGVQKLTGNMRPKSILMISGAVGAKEMAEEVEGVKFMPKPINYKDLHTFLYTALTGGAVFDMELDAALDGAVFDFFQTGITRTFKRIFGVEPHTSDLDPRATPKEIAGGNFFLFEKESGKILACIYWDQGVQKFSEEKFGGYDFGRLTSDQFNSLIQENKQTGTLSHFARAENPISFIPSLKKEKLLGQKYRFESGFVYLYAIQMDLAG